MFLNRFQNLIQFLLFPRPHDSFLETELQLILTLVLFYTNPQLPCKRIDGSTTGFKRHIKGFQMRQLSFVCFVKNRLQVLQGRFQSAGYVDNSLDIRLLIFCASIVLDAGGDDLLRDFYYGDYARSHGQSCEGFRHGQSKECDRVAEGGSGLYDFWKLIWTRHSNSCMLSSSLNLILHPS